MTVVRAWLADAQNDLRFGFGFEEGCIEIQRRLYLSQVHAFHKSDDRGTLLERAAHRNLRDLQHLFTPWNDYHSGQRAGLVKHLVKASHGPQADGLVSSGRGEETTIGGK